MMEHLSSDNAMYKLVEGAFQFQSKVFRPRREFFESLALGQHPRILFITCSDSRVDPSLITQTEPGDMFLIHNAGNIVPPHTEAYGGVGASIEYAVSILDVEHIIICGHSHCGAMEALLSDQNLANYPTVQRWLSFSEATKAILQNEASSPMSPTEQLNQCIEVNVQVQLDHLRTLPSVAAKLYHNKIRLHGWVYQIETGRIQMYSRELGTFIPLEDAYRLIAE